MDIVLDTLLVNLIIRGLKYAGNEFINFDFTKKYDEAVLLELLSINLVLSLANGIERQKISDKSIKKVVSLLHLHSIDESEISIPTHFMSIDEFITNCSDYVKCEYELRYRFVESLLYIFCHNGKNIKKYPDFIKLARFLEIKKGDFVYLVNKYKGEE